MYLYSYVKIVALELTTLEMRSRSNVAPLRGANKEARDQKFTNDMGASV